MPVTARWRGQQNFDFETGLNILSISSCTLHLRIYNSITVGTHTGMVKLASAPMVKVFWTRTLAFPISLEIKVLYST